LGCYFGIAIAWLIDCAGGTASLKMAARWLEIRASIGLQQT